MSNKDQKKDTEQKNGNGRSPQVGALLRASRLRVGEDLREVSDILCIRYLYLEAIEECRYGDLPGNTYAVGFIRSYAEHLGLDGDEVVRRYRAEQSGQKNATDLAFPTPVPDSGVPKGAIVFIGVLIALLVYGGWYVTTTDESILSDLISPVPDHLKHLVTGDDASTGTAATNVPTTAGSETTDTDVEKVVRETTAAAEQMVSDAGAEAQRTAEAAAEAAASTVENVGETAEAAAQSAETAAETVVEKVEETVQEVTAAPSSGEAMQAASDAASATTSDPSPVTSSATSTDAEAPSAPETPAATAAPTETASAESAVSAAGETVAEAAQAQSETATAPATEGATTPADTEMQTAATSSTDVAQNTAQTAEAATSVAHSAQPEVTAEDLNTLVLRQATGTSDQTSTPPAPPETASLNSGDPVGASGIVIRATSSSWVEIRNPANGDIVFTGLMNAGNTFNVPDTDGLTLDTGNAGALDITVDGTSVPKIGGIGAVRKNVALNADRLKAGTATDQ